MTLYMAVTADEYELPIYISDSAVDLARYFNINPDTVLSSITLNKSGKRKGRKFIRVDI